VAAFIIGVGVGQSMISGDNNHTKLTRLTLPLLCTMYLVRKNDPCGRQALGVPGIRGSQIS